MPRTSFTQEKAFEGVTVFREEKQKEGGKPLAGCNEANAQTSSAGGGNRGRPRPLSPTPLLLPLPCLLNSEFVTCILTMVVPCGNCEVFLVSAETHQRSQQVAKLRETADKGRRSRVAYNSRGASLGPTFPTGNCRDDAGRPIVVTDCVAQPRGTTAT